MDRSELLLTKLAPPPARRNCVHRQQLFERLDAGVAMRLTLVSAPAGYGKTTLLSSWYSAGASRPHSQQDSTLGWVSLEAADNDPIRFWMYVMRALQQAHAQIPTHPLAALDVSPLASTETILTALLNACSAARSSLAQAEAPAATVLILDDYHVISNSVIHTALTFLLEHLPPSLHVVIASRISPPLPLTKLRASGHLVEIGAAELRFSCGEIASFLHHSLPLSFSIEQIAQLREQTDGWILPLHLAALTWHGRQGADSFIASVGAGHHAIVEYLAAEVLAQQPADIRRFLLATSLLAECSGSLCDAMLQRTDSQRILEQLEREQLFLAPLDETHRWYRYQPLFAAFLQNRLRQQSPQAPDEMVAWRRRAADWYLEHESTESGDVEAVRHALPHLLAIHDWVRATGLIESVAERMLWQRGEVSTLLQWLEELPPKMIDARPRLALARAWGLTFTGQLDAAESALHQVERLLDAEDTHAADRTMDPDETAFGQEAKGEVLAVRARIAAFHDVERAGTLTGLALRSLPDEADVLRADLLLNLGYAQFRSHEYVAAGRTFQDARTVGRRSGNLRAVMLASRYLALSYVMRGLLNDAAATYRQALRLASADGHMPAPVAGTLHIGNAQLLYERNELDTALDHAQQGLALGARSGEMKTLLPAYLTLARIHLGLGDLARAFHAIDDAERLSDLRLFSWTAEDVAAARARLHLANGEIALAIRALSRDGWHMESAQDIPFSACPLNIQLAWARIWLAQQRPDAALALLRWVLDRVRREQPHSSTLPLDVVLYLALAASGADEQALALLADLLPSALAQGYVRTFVDEGALMDSLLRRVMQRRPVPGLEALLAAFPDDPQVNAPSDRVVSQDVTLLSAREVEVLRLMAAGLSNQQIADQLVVAVSTVRTHTKHIYRKLGVQGRVRAITRATSLHVL